MHNGIPVRYGKPTRRKNSKFPVIMIIIIVLLAILAAAYFISGIFFNEDKEETQQPQETNKTQVVEEKEPTVDVKENPADIPVIPPDESAMNDATDDEADTKDTVEADTPAIPGEDTVTEEPTVAPPVSETSEPQPELDLKDIPAAPDFPGESTVPTE